MTRGPSDAELRRLTRYGNELAQMTMRLPDMIGFPHGSECQPHVCCGRPGGQPLGRGDPSWNPASNAEPSYPGPGTAVESAAAGALGARHKTDRRRKQAVRRRQPRNPGPAND